MVIDRAVWGFGESLLVKLSRDIGGNLRATKAPRLSGRDFPASVPIFVSVISGHCLGSFLVRAVRVIRFGGGVLLEVTLP